LETEKVNIETGVPGNSQENNELNEAKLANQMTFGGEELQKPVETQLEEKLVEEKIDAPGNGNLDLAQEGQETNSGIQEPEIQQTSVNVQEEVVKVHENVQECALENVEQNVHENVLENVPETQEKMPENQEICEEKTVEKTENEGAKLVEEKPKEPESDSLYKLQVYGSAEMDQYSVGNDNFEAVCQWSRNCPKESIFLESHVEGCILWF